MVVGGGDCDNRSGVDLCDVKGLDEALRNAAAGILGKLGVFWLNREVGTMFRFVEDIDDCAE